MEGMEPGQQEAVGQPGGAAPGASATRTAGRSIHGAHTEQRWRTGVGHLLAWVMRSQVSLLTTPAVTTRWLPAATRPPLSGVHMSPGGARAHRETGLEELRTVHSSSSVSGRCRWLPAVPADI